MILLIGSALPDAMLASVHADLARIAFDDGAASAGWAARPLKRNAQALDDPCALAWRDRIAEHLLAHPLFGIATRAKRVIGPMLTRYRAGDRYGTHVDEAILDGSRADLSFTLFLEAPESYEGGELVLETPFGEETFKLPAGSLVLYPATTLHRVEAVTRGTRYAAVGWVCSRIRSGEQREVLFDLATARRGLFERHGPSREMDLLHRTLVNLERMWSED
jgi:PKHD-type hydroxylase